MAGLYIHIPFCSSKCHYCNFFSVASLKFKNQIIQSIQDELYLKSKITDEKIETIYFGGGTPSILNSNELDTIFDKIFKNFKVSSSPEITLEANPDHITSENLFDWNRLGFNRLSIGIQSLDEEILKNLNREHTNIQSIKAIELALKNGFSNLSCDLIFGIPGQTNKKLLQDLKIFLEFQITHISAYNLTVEHRTALDFLIKNNKYPKPSDDQSIEQFYLCSDFLKSNNYEHYEISNYALNKQYAKHNTNYWKQIPYLGFGPSAHSYYNKIRSWNSASINSYIKQIESGNFHEEFEKIDRITEFNEYIMLSLRTMWGIDLDFIQMNFVEFQSQLEEKIKKEISIGNIHRIENRILLTNKALIISDNIISNLLMIF